MNNKVKIKITTSVTTWITPQPNEDVTKRQIDIYSYPTDQHINKEDHGSDVAEIEILEEQTANNTDFCYHCLCKDPTSDHMCYQSDATSALEKLISFVKTRVGDDWFDEFQRAQ